MSHYFDDAKNVLSKANDEFQKITKAFAGDFKPEEFQQAHDVYETAAKLDVLTSQLVDKGHTRTVEGTITVDNVQAMVSIKGIDIRGRIQFEVKMEDGQWNKGHRENSQYGQIFVGDKGSLILSDNVYGRITFPLEMG